jgi:hypothetical protein
LFRARLKLVVPSDPSAFTVKCVVKTKMLANEGWEFDSVADHVPLILPAACEFDPQPVRIRPVPNHNTAAIFFMRESSFPREDGSVILKDAGIVAKGCQYPIWPWI